MLFQGELFVSWPGILECRRALQDLQLLSSSQPQRFQLCVHKSEIGTLFKVPTLLKNMLLGFDFSVVWQPDPQYL